MAKYSVEEVRAVVEAIAARGGLFNPIAARMLAAYAERIEADEGAVAMAWLAADGSGRVIDAKAKDAGNRAAATGSAIAVYSIPLFPHPPAQAAQVDEYAAGWRQAALEAVAPMLASLPRASSTCPMDGIDHPHAHSNQDVIAHLHREATRFQSPGAKELFIHEYSEDAFAYYVESTCYPSRFFFKLEEAKEYMGRHARFPGTLIPLSTLMLASARVPDAADYPKPHPETGEDRGTCCMYAYSDGWNDCRKAMLAAAPKPEKE